MTLGHFSFSSLNRYGVSEERLLISGNPNFDAIRPVDNSIANVVPQVLFVALHWVRDMSQFNQQRCGRF